MKDDTIMEFKPHEEGCDNLQQPLIVITRQISETLVELVVFLPVISGQNNLVDRRVLIQQVDYCSDVPYGKGIEIHWRATHLVSGLVLQEYPL